jgi:NitT/TauT family transport system permease protein
MWKRLGIALFWLAAWQGLALLVHNPVVLVGPWETLLALIDMLPTPEFRRALGGSLLHILGGFLLGACLGVLLAFLSYSRPFFRDLLAPVIGVMKAVPMVSFVVLLLIWAGSRGLSLYVTAAVVLPILYLNTLEGLLGTDRKLLELAQVYRMGFPARLRGVYLPGLKPQLLGAMELAVGMAWKSGVAAEVIGQPVNSLGNSLYRAKIYLDTDRILAVSAVTAILSWGLGKLVLLALRKGERKR